MRCLFSLLVCECLHRLFETIAQTRRHNAKAFLGLGCVHSKRSIELVHHLDHLAGCRDKEATESDHAFAHRLDATRIA